MQIIAQSKTASIVPYIHLGYLAVSSTKPQGGLLFGGVSMLLIAIPLVFTLIKKKRKSGRVRSEIHFRKHAKRVGVGWQLLVTACLLFWLSDKYGKRIYPAGNKMTQVTMQVLSFVISDYQEYGEPSEDIKALPDLDGEYDLASALDVSETQWLDGWKNPMLLKVSKQDDVAQYEIVSAGEDGEMGTDDDISSLEVLRKDGWRK